MFLAITLTSVSSAGLPPLVDPRVAPLHDPAVRADPDRLAAALRDLWGKVPENPPIGNFDDTVTLVRALAQFIALESDALRDKELGVGLSSGRPVRSMLVRIGLPAVQTLLLELRAGPDNEATRLHRVAVLGCLERIYEAGGAGRQMAAERVKLYAASLPGGEASQKWVLSALDAHKAKPPAPKN